VRILGVDLSALFRRHWEANQGREDSGAFERTVQAVASLREGCDRVAVCLDGGQSFRKFLEPAYKANRTRPPASYYEQQTRAVERLAADGCTIVEACTVSMVQAGGPAEGFFAEGDDVLASLAEWCATHGHECRIVGGDKDLLQLVDDARGVSVLRPDDPEAYTEAKVIAKLGLPPSKVADWLALAGDGADNFKPFPGWEERPADGGRSTRRPGIGDKGSVELILRWGSAAEAAEAATRNEEGTETPLIGGHVGDVLRRADPIEAARRGLALATLIRTLPIDFSPLEAEPKRASIVEDRPGPTAAKAAPVAAPAAAPAAAPVAAQAPVGRPAAPAPAPVVQAAPVAAPRPPEPAAAPAPPPPSTALAVVTPSGAIDRLAFQPRDLDSMWWLSQRLADSRMFAAFGNPEAIMAVAIEANERGIPLSLALRNSYVVKGKHAWSAQLLASLVLASGMAAIFEITESTPEQATLAYQRVGRPASTFVVTLDEAKRAGWVVAGSKWVTNPRTMLRWFAIREAARAFFPDVVAGMYTPEELRGDATGFEIDAEEIVVLPSRVVTS
jgi:5'-3' exonuclease